MLVDIPEVPVQTMGETKIKVIRNGEILTVTYLDLQVEDMFYHFDGGGNAQKYRVIDMVGQPDGNVEISTEIVHPTYGSVLNPEMTA